MTVLGTRSFSTSEDDLRHLTTCLGGSGESTRHSFSSSTDGSNIAAFATPPASPHRVRRHDPYAVVTQPYRKESNTVTWGVSHQPLIGACFYIPFPKIYAHTRDSPIVLPDSAVQLQVRQVRFEMETGQIRWLFRRLSGVHVLKAEKVVPGVINVWVASAKDADRVCNILHQNILFDFQGVFAPLNREQQQALVAYLDTRQFHTRSQRLPREPMTVTRMYAPPPPPPPPMTMPAAMPRVGGR